MLEGLIIGLIIVLILVAVINAIGTLLVFYIFFKVGGIQYMKKLIKDSWTATKVKRGYHPESQ